ncbi:hypothetical protein KMI_14g19300 [Encephalitozoon hellem]|uniref:RRM domain-containing protein n=1 Tax=Encephalitozoon hellem TaxID=27973 RepID=A0A9Q9FAA3_ENCHE|nr:uncharacterized protein EHEL_091190 [Encephalitozoon hellem ATCC 50504]AFM99014.1 hypothetical protein EHEL_091190 [Encephalitozoon hellem ATCC 50504]KAG5858547.1 hypothetical protein KMI_14g19300 [Encephalitozoon hellem]UTX44032.1 RRM domain-containing protein [Encephalitozoon hellem]WEL39515.1 RRM domain-containing protein [Encephalitozoon hellem]|eukprot:XP_003887995.1 hypothetical protein EHEL_091190 [Encephalitozoon hellem ATCC 50504]
MQSARKTNQLAIPDLPKEVTVKDLLEAFSKYGKEITGVKLSKQRRSRDEDLKVGYVEFETIEDTEKAYGEGKVQVAGEPRQLHFARRRDQRMKERVIVSSKKVYISGIPDDTNKDELCSLLGNCKISGDKGKNYLFAEYDNSEEQEKALNKINNMKINGSKLYAMPAYEKANIGRIGRKRSDSN